MHKVRVTVQKHVPSLCSTQFTSAHDVLQHKIPSSLVIRPFIPCWHKRVNPSVFSARQFTNLPRSDILPRYLSFSLHLSAVQRRSLNPIIVNASVSTSPVWFPPSQDIVAELLALPARWVVSSSLYFQHQPLVKFPRILKHWILPFFRSYSTG